MKKLIITKDFKHLLPFYLLLTLIIIAVGHNPFFWDKDVLNSKQAYWLLNNNFKFIFPNNLDAGYPAAMSFLLAFTWKLLGKTLFVTHLLMLPFALGVVHQIKRLLNHFFTDKNALYLTILIVIVDTTFLSQVIVYSTDLALLFFFLLSVNSVIYKNKLFLSLALIGLCLSHFRGIPLIGAVFLFNVYYCWNKDKSVFAVFLSVITLYLPAITIVITYYTYHYIQTGWLLKHDASPWRGCYEPVSVKGFFRNIVILAWRFIDYGKLFIWLPIFLFAGKFIKQIKTDKKLRDLSVLLLVLILIITPSMLFFKVLAAHRYLMPVYTLAILISMYLLFQGDNKIKIVRTVYAIIFIGLLSGYFWTYPDNIAKGWDATVAHLPFHSLKLKTIEYMKKNNIRFSEVGSGIPNTYELKYTHLIDDERYFHWRDFSNDKYIFYSNIINDFTDEELYLLKNKWIAVEEYHCLTVKVILYKNPYYAY